MPLWVDVAVWNALVLAFLVWAFRWKPPENR